MEQESLKAVLDRLLAVHNVLQANRTREAQKVGLSVTQSTVAQDLVENPGSSLQDVCRRLGWPKSTVSRVVDDLVTRGLALREIPPTNRRTVLLSMKRDAATCVPPVEGLVSGDARMTTDELTQLASLLDRFLGILRKP